MKISIAKCHNIDNLLSFVRSDMKHEILYSPKFSWVKVSLFDDIQLFHDKIFAFTKNADVIFVVRQFS